MNDDVPYPPNPAPDDVPEDLTEFPASYRTQEWILLACLMVFLMIYLGTAAVVGGLTVYMVLLIPKYHIFAASGTIVMGLAFLFLIKSFFRRAGNPFEDVIVAELKEADQPKLYAFIYRVCEDVGAEEPSRVHVVPYVTAAALRRVSVINLFVPPKCELILGLGLINALNLSEFKAVVAHEFGHFTQGSFLSVYTIVVQDVIVGIIKGQDFYDRLVSKMDVGGLKFFAFCFGLGPRIITWLSVKVFDAILTIEHQIFWEREFHADLVGASVAGSDAMTHGLMRTVFAAALLEQAVVDLAKAADHKLYTSDLYFHQHAAANIVRRSKKNPDLGERPVFGDPLGGKKVQVFDPLEKRADAESFTHPSLHQREENVKRQFVPCAADTRSPWILFDDAVEIRSRLTYKYYRKADKIPKGTELTDPREVQKFIDAEHFETTYDAKYDGAYDERMIDPGDIDDLNAIIAKDPWPDDRLVAVHAKLYGDVKGRAEDRAELLDQLNKVRDAVGAAGSKKSRRLIKDLEAKLDKAGEWFDSLDRRAYLVFVQMAYRVDEKLYYDLINRYRFHLAVQGIYKTARRHYWDAQFQLMLVSGSEELSHDDFVELMHTLRDARSGLKKILREAKQLDLPAMKNFEEGDRLADFLLDQDIVPELPETYVKGKWLDKLFRQLDQVQSKASRLHFKSLGGILRMQDDIAQQYLRAVD